MSMYTTGEVAKLCGVTVRTVQYYDTRGILVPTEVSEGGRRLYAQQDVEKMKIICFLRDAGLSIGSIGELLKEKDPGSVISILLEQQEKELREEIAERQGKLSVLEEISRSLRTIERFSVESIGDIAYSMRNKKKLRKIHAVMLGIGITADIIEIGTAVLWIRTGIWMPFAIGMPAVLAMTAWLLWFYYRYVRYICPQCHSVFQPKFWEMVFANHTFTTRKLTCTCCGHKGFCVETCAEEENPDGKNRK